VLYAFSAQSADVDLTTLSGHEHGHVPYPLILIQLVNK